MITNSRRQGQVRDRVAKRGRLRIDFNDVMNHRVASASAVRPYGNLLETTRAAETNTNTTPYRGAFTGCKLQGFSFQQFELISHG